MADVIPFPAVRPTRDKVHLVASRAFYTYPKHVLEAKLDSNQFSFIHIINPEFREKIKTEPNSIDRFKNVKTKYESFKDEGVLIKEASPSYYIYRQSGSHTYTGIIAGVSIEDYHNQVIKKHEDTITKRELMFKDYLDVCEFNAEPVLLTYPDNDIINNQIARLVENRAEFEFTTTDGICHSIWPITNQTDIKVIQDEFLEINALYIADGHHRSASSALLGQERKAKGSNSLYDQYFMCYLIPESDLRILDFNRLVKDLNGLTAHQFLSRLSHSFDVELSDTPVKSKHYNQFGMYLNDQWYNLTLKSVFDHDHPVDSLDPKILSDFILEPILNIVDMKTSDRIHFEGGPNGFDKMKSLVDKGKYKVGFSLFPVSADQLKKVADNGLTMPPKSTWIEPKLRSGLTIYEF